MIVVLRKKAISSLSSWLFSPPPMMCCVLDLLFFHPPLPSLPFSLPSFYNSRREREYSSNRKKRTKVMSWSCHRWCLPSCRGAVCTCELRLRHGTVVPESCSHRPWCCWDVATGISMSKWSAMACRDWSSCCLPRHARRRDWVKLCLVSPLAGGGGET